MPDEKADLLVVRMTRTGEDLDDFHVEQFRKRAGDKVECGEVVLEAEGSKAVMELWAPASGVIVSTIETPTEVRVGDALYTLRLVEPEPTPAEASEVPGTPPRRIATRVTWDMRRFQARAFSHPRARADKEVVEWAYLCPAILDALAAVPSLLRPALAGSDQVRMRCCILGPGGERWWHLALWPGSTSIDGLAELHHGPGPEAWATVIRLQSEDVDAGRVSPERGLVLAIGPVVEEAVARRGWVTTRPTASIAISVDGVHAPEHLLAFAEVLVEQLNAI